MIFLNMWEPCLQVFTEFANTTSIRIQPGTQLVSLKHTKSLQKVHK